MHLRIYDLDSVYHLFVLLSYVIRNMIDLRKDSIEQDPLMFYHIAILLPNVNPM